MILLNFIFYGGRLDLGLDFRPDQVYNYYNLFFFKGADGTSSMA